jgi:hypothetical protein
MPEGTDFSGPAAMYSQVADQKNLCAGSENTDDDDKGAHSLGRGMELRAEAVPEWARTGGKWIPRDLTRQHAVQAAGMSTTTSRIHTLPGEAWSYAQRKSPSGGARGGKSIPGR